MRKLPQYSFNEGFYIWFDINSKEEYYSTPLYMYKTDFDDDLKNYKRKIIQGKDFYKKKSSKKDSAPKHPATILYPFAEQFGRILINLLNADFSNFDKAYNTFFYLYGFELLKEYVPAKELISTYKSEEELVKIMKRVYEDSYGYLSDMQYNFRKCVDFVYNLNGNEEYEEQSIYSKFVAYTIKNDIYTFSQDVEVILDNYINIHNRHRNESIEHLMKGIEDKDPNLELYNVYTSTKLRSICFTILDQLVRQENLPIKTCQICGRYFIPTFRQNEIYCDLPNVDGSATCREKGATINYKKNLESVPALGLYRKMYQQKVMVVYRNKEDRKIKKDFDKWKKEAQAKIKLFKQGKLDEDALYKWMEENK